MAVSLLWLVSGTNQRLDRSCSTLGASQGGRLPGDTPRPRRGHTPAPPETPASHPGLSAPQPPRRGKAAGPAPGAVTLPGSRPSRLLYKSAASDSRLFSLRVSAPW